MSEKRVIKKIPMICVECGKTFYSLSFQAKYCKSCKLKIKRLKNRLYNIKKREEIRKSKKLKCQMCGCDLTEFKQTKKFCPTCREKAYRKCREKYYSENKKRIKDHQKEYYKVPAHKERHRIIARRSARRMKNKE